MIIDKFEYPKNDIDIIFSGDLKTLERYMIKIPNIDKFFIRFNINVENKKI